MPRFDLPAISAAALNALRSLRISQEAWLEEHELASIRDKLGAHDEDDQEGEAPSWHATFVEVVSGPDGFAGELSGIIGLHLNRESPGWKPESAGDTGCSLHFRVDLRRGRLLKDATDRRWDEMMGLLSPIMSTSPVRTKMEFVVESAVASPAVTLPITLGSNTPGFNQIRGIELANVPEGEGAWPLYTVFLLPIRESILATTSVDVKAPFDRTLLATAAERAMTVTRLALPRWEGL